MFMLNSSSSKKSSPDSSESGLSFLACHSNKQQAEKKEGEILDVDVWTPTWTSTDIYKSVVEPERNVRRHGNIKSLKQSSNLFFSEERNQIHVTCEIKIARALTGAIQLEQDLNILIGCL